MISISIVGDVRLLTPESLSLSGEIKKVLQECVFNVLNFEAPIACKGAKAISKSGPALDQSKEGPTWLESQGWNVVSLANNHALDYGEEGLRNTIRAFHNATVIGAGNWEDAYNAKILKANDGRKVAFLALTQREYGVLADESDKDRLGCAWICHPAVLKAIQKARSEADLLVVIPHAGVEGFAQPLPEWRTIYKSLIDMGCDAVVASHPHIPQGWELYSGKPIFYSLGNFCFQTPEIRNTQRWYDSLCCVLHFDDDNKCTFDVIPLIYNPQNQEITVHPNIEITSYLEEVNSILADEETYQRYVDVELQKEWEAYLGLFARSGLISNIFSRSTLSLVKGMLLGRMVNKAHLLNNLQNESHRWAIERIIRNKYNIVY